MGKSKSTNLLKPILTKNSILRPEELILTLDIVPKDPSRFFKYFIKQIESKEIVRRGQPFGISEQGSRDDLSTKFQLLGMIQASLTHQNSNL